MFQNTRQSGFSLLELLIVVAMALIVAGIAIPNFQRAMRNYRLMGDARAISGEVQLAKMRAAANFTRARVKFSASGYETQVFCQALNSPRVCINAVEVGRWKTLETSGIKPLSSDIRFGAATQTLPPPGTQATLGQPMPCRRGRALISPLELPAGRCIIFNSRGYPVDEDGNAYGDYGIYITDGTAVQGTTVSRAGVVASWRHDAQDTAAASWFRH